MAFLGDVTMMWNQVSQSADWSFANGDLLTGSDLATSVIISLFSNAPAPASYVPTDGSTYRGGWWGSQYLQWPLGSRLWMLARTSYTSAVNLQNLAQVMCSDALQWMISSGVAATVVPVATLVSAGQLQIVITITQPTQQAGTVFSFALLWNAALAT